ncbi:unnamed protein product [Penicillium bialowiezense]
MRPIPEVRSKYGTYKVRRYNTTIRDGIKRVRHGQCGAKIGITLANFARRPEKRQRFALDTEETGSGPGSGQGVQSSSTQVTSGAETRRESSDITGGETTHRRKLPFTVLPGRSAAEAKHFAELNAMAKSDNARKVHERRTKAEDKRFMGLMATLGSHYAAIKKENNAFPEAAGGPYNTTIYSIVYFEGCRVSF